MILGFGINVKVTPHPPDVAAIATSIEAELGRAVEPGPVLAETLAALRVQVQLLETGERASVLTRWRALAPLAFGSTVEWEHADGRRRGTTAGIDDDGALLVREAAGLERISSGDVRWL